MDLKNLNVKYALVNVAFLLLVCGTLGYAYNFLSQSGFDDGTTGMVITAISLLGVFAGPAAGDLVDKSERISAKMFILGSMVLCIVLTILLIFLPAGSPVIIPVVIIAFMSSSIGMPLLNGMAFIYESAGGVINYGLCRGLGSAAYAVGSNILGRLWSAFGKDALPYYIIVAAVFTLVATWFMPDAPKTTIRRGQRKEQSLSLIEFFGKYQKTLVVVGALVLMYFCHFIINTYMAKIVGQFVTEGVETVQGNALFIAAMLELPVMFGFTFLLKRFSVNQIMAVASVIYSIKHVITLFAGSVPVFYFAMALQMLSYAALVPATVYFANEHVGEADRNKGQAVFSASSSIGGLLASFIGGWLFNFAPVKVVLTVGVIASIAGTALMLFGLRLLPSTRRNNSRGGTVARVRLKK